MPLVLTLAPGGSRHGMRLCLRTGVVSCCWLTGAGVAVGLFVLWGGEPSEEDLRLVEPLDSWAYQTEWEMKQTARVVVGPDEPFEGRTHADMEAAHWESLTRILREQGVEVEPAELEALPHDVELSDRVLARIGRGGLPQG